MDGGGTLYRGTSMDQDGRFSNKEKKLMKQINWPAEFSIKVDIKKVDLAVIKPWIHRKVIDYLGDEDDLLIDYIASALEHPSEKGINPKELQLHLTGFLEKNAGAFMKELWTLLIEAQSSPDGIPAVLVQEKKDEIKQQRQEIEDTLAKLENIKAFMSGSARPNASASPSDEQMAIEADEAKDRRGKDKTANISRLASKLKNERGGSQEKEGDKGRSDEVEKDKRRDRDGDRNRDRDRDRRYRDKERERDGDRSRRDDRRRSKDREREREKSGRDRDRDRERDSRRRREKEKEREREREPKEERKRSSKQEKKKASRSSSSSSEGSSSSESRERSESAEKKKEKRDQKTRRKRSEDNKDKRKVKPKKKRESSSEDSGSDKSSDSGSDSGSGSGSDSSSDSDNEK